MTTKAQQADRDHAVATLRKLCPPGTTIYSMLRHRSASGMSRLIDFYVISDNAPFRITGLIATAGIESYDRRGEALRVSGCGMDMGFHVTHNLSYLLHPDGFDCLGPRESGAHYGCPSNEHSNGDRDYTPHHHATGGYSLRSEWM